MLVKYMVSGFWS